MSSPARARTASKLTPGASRPGPWHRRESGPSSIAANSIVEASARQGGHVVTALRVRRPGFRRRRVVPDIPHCRTSAQSFTEVPEGAGPLTNYINAFTNPDVLVAIRNNVVWLLVAPAVSVVIGLGFAAIVDRIRRESTAKSFVFMPLAISFVGAAVIWKFIYAWKPAGKPQIGVLNAIWVSAGGILVDGGSWIKCEPIPWLQVIPSGPHSP